jgi:streptogramin lyase
LKVHALPPIRLQKLALALAVLPALSAGYRPAVAQTFTEFPTPTANSGPYGITTGPDGALWFTERNANKIGRITIAGVITEFPIPTAVGVPAGITTGPDGAVHRKQCQSDRALGGDHQYPRLQRRRI